MGGCPPTNHKNKGSLEHLPKSRETRRYPNRSGGLLTIKSNISTERYGLIKG